MIKSLKYILVSVLIFFASACSDDFLEEENRNQLTDGSFYQTQNDFYMALNSLYSPLAHAGLFGYTFNYLFGSFEDRILFESPAMDRIAINPSGDPADNQLRELWRDTYMGVYRTNAFINELNKKPVIEGMDVAMRNDYLAQAKALRAAYMFYLVTIYDRPPYYDDMTIPTDINVPPVNGKPEQFWTLIKSDLQFASENLPASLNAENLGRITSGAALSFLGKAMLFKHYYYHVRNDQKASAEDLDDLRLAKNALREVIQSNQYRLIKPMEPKTRKDYLYALLSNSAYVDLPVGDNLYQSENNDESVWEIQYTDDRQGQGYLPGWMWSGSRNFEFFGPINYRNHEGHPDFWGVFETEGAPAPFDRDPRAYATFYLDGDTMDFRPENPRFGRRQNIWNREDHTKEQAVQRLLIDLEDNPFPTTGFGIKKYYYPTYFEKNSPYNDPINRRKIRFADVLLLYAEVTYLLQEDVGEGLAALNRVRARVDMPAVPALTKQAIMHERDVELAFECHRWRDLVRWSFDPAWNVDIAQKLNRQLGPEPDGSFFVKGKHEFLPIPQREIDLSRGNLQQNPGY